MSVALVIVLLSQRSSTATPQTSEPAGRYQLLSGQVVVPTRPPSVAPAIFRIDTQSGIAWYYDSSLNKWKLVNNP